MRSPSLFENDEAERSHGSTIVSCECQNPGNHGFVLTNLQDGGSGYATTVHNATDFDPNGSGLQIAKGCIVFAGQVTTPTDPAVTNAADLHGRVIYIWGNIALNKSKTVKVSYRRF